MIIIATISMLRSFVHQVPGDGEVGGGWWKKKDGRDEERRVLKEIRFCRQGC